MSLIISKSHNINIRGQGTVRATDLKQVIGVEPLVNSSPSKHLHSKSFGNMKVCGTGLFNEIE